MSSKLEKIVKTYKTLSQIPALVNAQIHSSNIINTVWSQRNLEKGVTSKFTKTIILDKLQKSDETFPIDVTSEIMSRVSKSQEHKAVLRESDSNQFLEIWKHDNLIRVVDLTTLDMHGKVYADIEFGALEFSPDERKVLYVAEKKIIKSEPFYKRKKPDEQKNGGDASKPAPMGQEHVFEQDWGEQLVGKKKSILAEYDIENDFVDIVKGLPEKNCVAQPKYSSDGKFIVGVAYFTEPRKLGLIYCTNRPSTIFQLDIENNHYIELNLENKAVKSPIFTPSGDSLVWLQREAGGPHHSCMSLVKASFPLKNDSEVRVVVDAVKSSRKITGDRYFYGLYNTGFPRRPWLNENEIFVNTNQKYTINSYLINIDSGNITEVEYAEGSQLIMDVKDKLVLALRRNYLSPDKLSIAHSADFIWTDINQPQIISEIRGSSYKYLDLEADDPSVKNFNAIYLNPGSQDSPLVVYPHGGPHAAFANYFSLEQAVLLSLGYSILYINYRGSIGSGQDSVDFLLGKAGTADVQDCIQAVDSLLKEVPSVGLEKMVLSGGSHGGFLVTHLSGQYPDKFKAVVARNPVIDVASMSMISDIPDWCYVEAGESYSQKGQIQDDILLKMRNCSPIMHAHKVTAPTLLEIGSKDLRVPPHQGTEYYHRLKANGVKVKMNLYDDNHPLGSVPNEMDHVINSVLWFEEHLNRE